MKPSLVRNAIRNVMRQQIGVGILLAVTACCVVGTSLIPPQILKRIIDHNLVPGSTDGLPGLALAYLAVLLAIGLFDFLKETILTVLGQKITREIRLEMMQKLEKVHARFFSAQASGTVVSRFTNDVDAINTLFTSGIIGMVIDGLKIVGIVVSIGLFSSKLGLLVLILLPLIFTITRLFQKKMLKAQIENRKIVGRVNNHISESLKNILMIKSFSKEAYMEKNYQQHLLDNYRTVEKVNFYDSVFPPVIQILRAIAIGLVVILSSRQMNYLGISLGMVAASIDLIANLFAPIENLGMELQNIQTAISGIRRVDDFGTEPEDDSKNTALQAKTIIPDPRHVQLAFNNLSFNYEEGTDVLQNITLQIKPQEKVTFVGRTGVGKSTLFKLVLGLLKPSEGNITINGIDVYSIPNSEKRRIFGIVDQSFPILKGSVAEQISLHDPAVSIAAIARALEFVGLKETVDRLDQGMDTVISGESPFSQGQKELLAIARAIVTNPPVLLLDEMTASLDSITEAKIVAVLQKASAAHTILAISHRLSSMLACDTLVILDNGRVENAGSPQILLQEDDWYRRHLALERLTWR